MSTLLYAQAVVQKQQTQQEQQQQEQQQEQQQQQQEWYNYQQQLYQEQLYQQQLYQQQLQQWQQQYAYPSPSPPPSPSSSRSPSPYLYPISPILPQQYQKPNTTFASIVARPLEPIPIPTKLDIYLEKQSIFDTIISLNPGITFGSYVVQNIIKQNILPLEEPLQQLNNNPKLPNHIEIILHSSKCEQFLRNIVRAFSKPGYSLKEKYKGDIKKMSEYMDILLEPENMFLNSITITVKKYDATIQFSIKSLLYKISC